MPTPALPSLTMSKSASPNSRRQQSPAWRRAGLDACRSRRVDADRRPDDRRCARWARLDHALERVGGQSRNRLGTGRRPDGRDPGRRRTAIRTARPSSAWSRAKPRRAPISTTSTTSTAGTRSRPKRRTAPRSPIGRAIGSASSSSESCPRLRRRRPREPIKAPNGFA